MDLQSGWDWRRQELYHFRAFTLDVSERLLVCGGRRVPLAPKAFDVLVVLVRRSKCLVTKRELLDHVWRGVFVEPGILTVHVSSIRKALDDWKRSPTYIETVSRSGYRFIADVLSIDAEQRARQRVDRRPCARADGDKATSSVVPTWMNTSLDVGVHADDAKTTSLSTSSSSPKVQREEA
jgi:DNA-binding winged helix-turn-helix (wHTH) protein